MHTPNFSYPLKKAYATRFSIIIAVMIGMVEFGYGSISITNGSATWTPSGTLSQSGSTYSMNGITSLSGTGNIIIGGTSDIIDLGGNLFTIDTTTGQIITVNPTFINSNLISPGDGGLIITGNGNTIFSSNIDSGPLTITSSTATLATSITFGSTSSSTYSASSIILNTGSTLILGNGTQIGGNSNNAVPFNPNSGLQLKHI